MTQNESRFVFKVVGRLHFLLSEQIFAKRCKIQR
jgi:hypothetical protein